MRPNSLRDRHKQTVELEWEEKSWGSPRDRFRARTSKSTQATSQSVESLRVTCGTMSGWPKSPDADALELKTTRRGV